MPLLPTPSAPFGPLEPIHTHILTHATQLTWSNAYQLFVIPFLPLYVQALLLRYEGTRAWRMALGVLGVGLIVNAGVSFRFGQPWLNALNNGLGIGIMTISVRYLELGFIKGKLVDPYYEKRGRHPLLAAFDTCINARWIGLGAVDVDEGTVGADVKGKKRKGENGVAVNVGRAQDGGVKMKGDKVPRIRQYESWFPQPTVRRTRLQAVIRHSVISLRAYLLTSLFLTLLRDFGSNTIGSVVPVPNALHKFSHGITFELFPHLPGGGFIPPWWLVELVAVMGVAVTVWLALSGGYHAIAALMVGSGLYETEAWEVELFDSPMMADSLLDFWGRRWHQFFRHQFILISTLILRALHLPPSSPLILMSSFLLSGTMHALGQYLMDPVPRLLPIFALFPISGIGCFLEVLFKRLTGKKVRGKWGRVWTWTVMLSTGRWAAMAWFDSGVGGSYMVPDYAGEWVKPFILEWVVRVKEDRTTWKGWAGL
ncbi:hypothetical protein IAT38_000837 [Cryptococcus sp. DSM 104549]